MFLHLSVILFTGGCLPLYMLGYTPWSDTVGVCLSACWDTPPGRHPPLGRQPPPHGDCSGRYASYWNAFLLIDYLHDNVSLDRCLCRYVLRVVDILHVQHNHSPVIHDSTSGVKRRNHVHISK